MCPCFILGRLTEIFGRRKVQLQHLPTDSSLSFGFLFRWYHGRISRDETEIILHSCEDGVFLVRDSIHFQGDCTLSVAINGRVDHYRILRRDGLLEVDGGDCSFHSLIDLVQVMET